MSVTQPASSQHIGDMTVITEQFYKSAIKEKQQCPITRGIWLTPNMMGVPQITARIGFKWFKNYQTSGCLFTFGIYNEMVSFYAY